MKTTNESRKRIILTAVCVLFLSAAAVAVSQLIQFRTKATYNHYYSSLKVGEIAEESITSNESFDIIDFDAMEKAKAEASSAVLPRYTISIGTGFEILQRFESIKSGSKYSERALDCAYEILLYIVENGLFSVHEVAESIAEGYDRAVITNYEKTRGSDDTVDLSEVVTLGNLTMWINSRLTLLGRNLSSDLVFEIQSIVKDCVRVNANYNSYETELASEKAADEVEPEIINIEKGQVFIEKDHVITQDQLDLLLLVSKQSSISLIEIARQILFCLLCFSIEYIVFNYLISKDDIHYSAFIIAITACVAVSFAAVFYSIYETGLEVNNYLEAFMPVVFAPIFITMLTGRKRIGFVAAFLFGTGMCVLPGANIETLFYCCFTGCICVFTVKLVNRRFDSILQGFVSIMIVTISCFLFMLTDNGVMSDVPVKLVLVAVTTFVSVIVINILIPVFERILNLPTVFRLYELAHGESKILKRLENEAPGTYNHSCRVADLAQNAAKAVGANDLLAKVGGLYHDIGKVEHPEYFVENQSGENKHDDLNPSLSASIIKSHVKVGAEKGREAGLPKEVVDIIFQHHGNDVISFFYWEAVKDSNEEAKGTVGVEKTDYSYNAETPSSVECAIVMLADSVEAAARTISSPSAAQFEKLINQIILTKIEHGQLKSCKLTMGDLDIISQAFLKSLCAMYHSRIEYPDEEEEQ